MNGGLFLDSSVLVALIAKESDWPELSERLEQAERRFTSAVAVLEAVIVLSSRMAVEPGQAEGALGKFLSAHDVGILPIDAAVARRAVRAFEDYGKGRHSARLNLGDCISYGCAREAGLTLFYKGNDFALTDLA